MLKGKWKRLGLIAGLALTLFAAGCGSNNDNNGKRDASNDGDLSPEAGESIELVYVEWDTEIASTHVIGKVLEDLGYDVTYTPIDNAVMWQSIATGEADAMVAAWLPATHGALYEEYKDQIVDLGENLRGAKIGLVVPAYMEIDSIADLPNVADELGSTITAIEPGAGVVQAAEKSLEVYDLDGWEVAPSSSGAMATALGDAIMNEEAIVVTGWSPHWKFSAYDLKYLEDPQGAFGGEEIIATMVRKGLEEDLPYAYQILDSFHWSEEDMNSVMLEIQNGARPENAAAAWVEANQDKVAKWIDVE